MSGNGPAESSALDWSITAMRDATGRLRRASPWDRPRALAVISEAVWWVTIVDATLVRYHSDAYDSALADRTDRREIEETLAGLRFARNRMGYHADHADFAAPPASRSGSDRDLVRSWKWKSVPRPALSSLQPRGREWELARYRAYADRLAGRTVGETFARAAAFLTLVYETAKASPDRGHPAEVRIVPSR